MATSFVIPNNTLYMPDDQLFSTVPGAPDTSDIAASTSGGSGWGTFFSGLATDATSLIGGLTSNVTQAMAIDRNKALAANGYTVPLFSSGLNGGALPTSTILFFALIAIVLFALVK